MAKPNSVVDFIAVEDCDRTSELCVYTEDGDRRVVTAGRKESVETMRDIIADALATWEGWA